MDPISQVFLGREWRPCAVSADGGTFLPLPAGTDPEGPMPEATGRPLSRVEFEARVACGTARRISRAEWAAEEAFVARIAGLEILDDRLEAAL